VIECVPNVSEGRRADVLDALSAATGPSLLDRHVDPDHGRAVFTLAGPGARDATVASRALARAVARLVDLEGDGVHPRLGALDVVPFVALDEARVGAVEAAHDFARWLAHELAVPVYLYDDADPAARSLPDARRDAFVRRAPDLGPAGPHPRLGAAAVGARPPLVAVNCWLDSDEVAVARAIATRVREQHGGLPAVRALGLALASRGVTQVSMNLVDLDRTGIEAACTEVRRLATDRGARVTRIELVGLLPAAELARCSTAFLEWSGLTPDQTIEHRLAHRP
jgi:glutamate formiminotransferase